MYRYDNQDHSMLTVILAARNILGANFDLRQVNDDQEYGEEVREDTQNSYVNLSTQLSAQINQTQPHVLIDIARETKKT